MTAATSATDTVRIGIIGTGQRAVAFARQLAETPGVDLNVLCDTDDHRLHAFAAEHELTDRTLTTRLDEALAGVDAVVLTVPDFAHRDVAVAAFEAGRHVMLEKPMALTVEDCKAIIRAKQKSGKVLQLGFVLRCTNFYRTVKQVVDSGKLGQIMSISAVEYLGMSHSSSFMRRWHRKSANSGSFLLTKCSHDMDLLNWLTDSRARRVASFGDNNYFLPRKQPATHCSICPEAERCRYRFNGGFVYMTPEDKADPSRNDFDLCVYNPDKDVVDNQVCILEYENEVRATFTLQLFCPPSLHSGRGLTITGSEAYLVGGNALREQIHIHYSDGREMEVIDASATNASGHGGGDAEFIAGFVRAIQTGTEPPADLNAGLASTVAGVALEQARREGRVVEIDAAAYEV